MKLDAKTFSMDKLILLAAGVALILFANFAVPQEMAPVIAVLNAAGLLIIVVPYLLRIVSFQRKKKDMEEQFIIFMYDLTESINSGMSLPLALKYCSKREYGSLTQYVNSLSAQVDWGIPFKKALETFAVKTGSPVIKRAVATVIETYKVGGKISTTLSSVAQSLALIDKIKRERLGSVYSQIFTCYVIYFVFIAILVILQIFLIPAMLPLEELTASSVAAPISIYTESFIAFILIQGVFAGLATGKLSEGSLLAGVKHSFLMAFVGYTVFSIAVSFA
jgi:flagellar protein FlaJ